MLTTITPYWGRPEMLRSWLKSIAGSTIPKVTHIVLFVNELPPQWFCQEAPPNVIQIPVLSSPDCSIGFHHDYGATLVKTEWMMKLDVDALPNVRYFRELLPVLESAEPRRWFNGGMVYINHYYSDLILSDKNLPISESLYKTVFNSLRTYTCSSYLLPSASNFICRVQDYLSMGGCDARFKGWGWEDYQQMFGLEARWKGSNPLPGGVDIRNVTVRCRNEIGRPRAKELWEMNSWLCLFHKWHTSSPTPGYRSFSAENKQVLLEYIQSYV